MPVFTSVRGFIASDTEERQLKMKAPAQTEQFDVVEKLPKNRVDHLLSALVADGLRSTQISKYTRDGGHGFAAEDANHFTDLYLGKDAEVVGIDNAKNGPDRSVNGVLLQTKYYSSAEKTIKAAFEFRRYRYGEQRLEVPKDQYAECVKLMADRIRACQVPGVWDPADAKQIIVEGAVTYKQARNIARAANVDSLMFDVKTQSVLSLSIFGVSFGVTFAQYCWRGETVENAARAALESALVSGGMTLAIGVASAQVLRTPVAAWGAEAIQNGVQAVSETPVGGAIIRQVAAGSARRAVSGTAAASQVVRVLRTHAVIAPIATVVISSPDLYRAAFQRSISWKQFTKNLSINAAGVAAGTAGWLGGSAAGAALGSAVPGIGTAAGAVVGGIAGSLGIGMGGTLAVKSVADRIVADDSKRLIKILQTELARLASEYLLTESEFERILAKVRTRVDAKWLRLLYKQPHKRDFIRVEFEHLFKTALQKRPPIVLPSVEALKPVMDRIGLLAD